MLHIKDLIFEYTKRDEEGNAIGKNRAVDNISLDAKPGEFIAILGHNGSGKSTLAKHINALLYPTSGTVTVDGMETTDDGHIWDIRQEAGMIFQNPDNQIIGQVVEEDVGFGPENIGMPTAEIWERVEESLKTVGMYDYRKASPNHLSGGQKQRVSIAGVIAMHPKCIIMDEPTAMLDPQGRHEVIRAARALNDVEKITIILITHYMEEVIYADRVYVMDQGHIAMTGTPREIFAQVDRLRDLRLGVPQTTLLGDKLRKAGIDLPDALLNRQEIADALLKQVEKNHQQPVAAEDHTTAGTTSTESASETAAGTTAPAPAASAEDTHPIDLQLDHVSYIYDAGTQEEHRALDDVSLTIHHGEFIGLIGHTGSGKSTLVTHLNGLMKPTSGTVSYRGENIFGDKYDRRNLRANVGLVFQYPEHQLFEADVFTDVCFGPKNLGLSTEEVEKRAHEAIRQVGLSEELEKTSPFDLSGGQKRRVAIAGVLAMQPEVLVLDEPTAGLDPKGREEILDLVSDLHTRLGITVVLVSHSMEDVAEYVDRILVADHGKIRLDDTPAKVFRHQQELEEMGLAAPEVTYVMRDLAAKGIPVNTDAITVDEACDSILKCLG